VSSSAAFNDSSGASDPDNGIVIGVTHFPTSIKTYDIHDIRRGKCPVNLSKLMFLIESQASLHGTTSALNVTKLDELLQKQVNQMRGFVLCTEKDAPVAYAIYYPMIDHKGERIAYCEDFFIVEAYRGYGAAGILFHELAARTMKEDATALQWATDGRNIPVHKYVKKLGAEHPEIITISANKLLTAPDIVSKLKPEWDKENFITVEHTDVDWHKHFNLPNIVRKTGDMSFRGFATFEKSNRHDPVALTMGWIHTSTFQLNQGLHLEQPVFINGYAHKENVIHSVIDASQRYAKTNKLGYFRWHIGEKDSLMRGILIDTLGLPVDRMLPDQPQSNLIVYTLSNGALKALANANPPRTLLIPANAPIGQRPTSNGISVPAPST
jgi:hypothetical protein